MKKILCFALFFSLFNVWAADGPFFGFFGIETDNPLGVLSATDKLSQDCPGGSAVVRLMAENFNADEVTTHSYAVLFENNESYLQWSGQWASCPGWTKYFQTMSEISNSTYEMLAFPVVSGGDTLKDKVFVSWIMDVSDPAASAKAYSELMNSADSRCPGSWGLAAWGPGSRVESYGTHMAFCGYPDMASAMEVFQERMPTKSMQKFYSKAGNVRQLIGTNLVTIIKDYMPN